MNNVWSSIVCRAPCSPARATPILQLFSGYARSQSARYSSRCMSSSSSSRQPVSATRWAKSEPALKSTSRCSFSTTAVLAAKSRANPPPPSKARDATPTKSESSTWNDSPVKPAETVASHTEGLPEKDEEPLTWRDYDPEGGMPLPTGELPQANINAAFGSEELDADTGNYILSVMYWRRQSGALIDSGLDFPRRSGVTKEQALKALQYVRSSAPHFDEQGAGQQWAEEESVRLQNEIRERSVQLGIYKADAEDVAEGVEEEESQQGTAYGRERSSTSVLQKHREEREAQWELEQAAKLAQKERDDLAALHAQRGPLELIGGVQPTVALTTTGPGGVAIGQAPTSGWLMAPVERKPWVKYYEEQAQTIKDNVLPQISILGRLAPSFLFTLAVLGLALFVSNNYTPPPKSARLWPDTPPAVATLATLTAVLVFAFIASRLPPVWKTLNKYLTIVPAYPYAPSVLGAAFRHDTVVHLGSNLATLWILGLLLHEDVGRGTFLAIFFASATTGGLASLTYNVLSKNWMTYVFGSSGGVLGVVAAACTLRPNGSITVMGYEVPVAAWVFLALLGGAEVVAAVRGTKTVIDHAGHVGGIISGVCAAVYLRRKARDGNEDDGLMKMQRKPE